MVAPLSLIGTELKEASDHNRARLIKQLCASIGILQDDDDMSIFVKELTMPAEDNKFRIWKTYPASWKSISTHVSAFSATSTFFLKPAIIEALGVDVCDKAHKACREFQDFLKTHADDFQQHRFPQKSSSLQQGVPRSTTRVNKQDVLDSESDDEIDIRASNVELAQECERLRTANVEATLNFEQLKKDIDSSNAKLDSSNAKLNSANAKLDACSRHFAGDLDIKDLLAIIMRS
jgi:hypothetical protein